MSIPWSKIASGATTVAVFVAAWQLWLSNRHGVVAFEDSLAREYRELVSRIPTKALLGDDLDEEEYLKAFDEFYHYIDLCNEQAFLHKNKRISDKAWAFWFEGMKSNLARPAFKRAWSEIAARAGRDFAELKNIVPPGDFSAAPDT